MNWMKDGKIFSPPLTVGGVAHHSPTPELLLEAGYVPCTTEMRQPKRVLKFDRYKVILALGDAWEEKKAELVAAGLFDKFMASPYLSLGDPRFRKVWKSLTAGQKHLLLSQCQYGR